jgi:murein DD-endopeptidase MepM/ murein hydrolase activator NlpD
MTINPKTGQLILAGQERLYFLHDTSRFAGINGGPQLQGPQPHDPQLLANLQPKIVPIGGSGITSRDLQLPGAPRHYRLGIHEGLDFYWQPGTPIRAVADGTVIRANHDFVPANGQIYNALQAETEALTYTTEEALDLYRGRQVWIEHADGTISRNIHLSVIYPEIVEGATVMQGQIIGEVGNSGSPASLESDTEDAHLHYELWIDGHYLGQFLRPIEVRELIEYLFGQ